MRGVGVPSKEGLLALVLCARRASAGPSWTPGLRTLQENRPAASSDPVLASGPTKNPSRPKCLLSLSGSQKPIPKTEILSIHVPEPHPGWLPGPQREPLVPDGYSCHRVTPSAPPCLVLSSRDFTRNTKCSSFSLSLRHFPEFHGPWASLPTGP